MDKSGGKLEEIVVAINLGAKDFRDKVQVLEDRFSLLSNFTVKVTHAVATTLNLLKDN